MRLNNTDLEKWVVETKTRTTEKLYELLNTTSAFRDLVSLKYVRGAAATPYSEAVIATWENGSKGAINVNMDSEYALILDVLKHIDDTRYPDECD